MSPAGGFYFPQASAILMACSPQFSFSLLTFYFLLFTFLVLQASRFTKTKLRIPRIFFCFLPFVFLALYFFSFVFLCARLSRGVLPQDRGENIFVVKNPWW
jgi:hypothetical protein